MGKSDDAVMFVKTMQIASFDINEYFRS